MTPDDVAFTTQSAFPRPSDRVMPDPSSKTPLTWVAPFQARFDLLCLPPFHVGILDA
ncbi:hypothetical protein RRSWK_03271 [Rhodopirellula sp. SWK7]|nr:hypothetical protein RRSWK_03271 [Rhodopirellula sp. SWK7]